MVRSLSNFFTGIMQRWMPDALIFAIVLTLVVMVAGVFGGDNSPTQMVRFWGGGIWNLLAFSMQVILSLVTGSILAQTDLVKNILRNLARVASTPTQAIVLMTVIAAVCFWISWGFGLIGSALMAREIARRVRSGQGRSLSTVGCFRLLWLRCLACRVIRLYSP
jgi:short-chain fatty acids transporter